MVALMREGKCGEVCKILTRRNNQGKHLHVFWGKTKMDYLNLMRVKHYIKNFLVFIPLFFNKSIFKQEKLTVATIGFTCFSLISSAVYIINDIRDMDLDKNHPKKKERPLASGKISVSTATIIMIGCIIISLTLTSITMSYSVIFPVVYLIANIAYSFGLKKCPIVDVVILASGFVFRVLYGGMITNISISKWLYMVIVFGSLYMALGKRRNELRKQTNTREVLKYYSEAFLDKNMYVSVALVITFYALWTLDLSISPMMTWTVPFFAIILLRFSYDIEGDSDGDPVEILMQDKILFLLGFMYLVCIFILIYII